MNYTKNYNYTKYELEQIKILENRIGTKLERPTDKFRLSIIKNKLLGTKF